MDRRTVIAGFAGAVGIAGMVRLGRADNTPPSLQTKLPAAATPPQPLKTDVDAPQIMLQQFPLGGGGFVTGIDVSADGRRLACRTDVANAYVRDEGDKAWRPLFSQSTMLREDYDPLPKGNDKSDGQGVAGIRIAPANKDIIYASYYGYIWKSVDGGRSVRRTSLRQVAMPSNAGLQRLFNRTIDVHPANPDIVICGTCGEGSFASTNGGKSWEKLKLPGAGQSLDDRPGIHLVLFHPETPQDVFVFVGGVGLHRSRRGVTGPFVAVAGGPTQCSNLVAGPNGSVYLCEQTLNNKGLVWKLDGSDQWTTGDPEHEASVITFDPRSPSHVIAVNPNGHFMISEDGGQTFGRAFIGIWSKGEVAWTSGQLLMYPSQILVNPRNPDDLWVGQGVGVAEAIGSNGKFYLTDHSAGIEELCIFSICAPPGHAPIAAAWDKPFWRLEDRTSYTNNFRYPVTAGKSHNPSIVIFSSYCDWAGDDPSFLVGVVAPTSDSAPGYSVDAGRNWQAFSSMPDAGWGHGGCIAASTKENIVLLPSNNGTGAYTLDGGKRWAPVRLDGQTPTANFANAFYVSRKNLAADKARRGVFALVYTIIGPNDSINNPLGGVWVTVDGGQTWVQRLKGVISSGSTAPEAVRAEGLEYRQFWQCQLEYVPGRTAELLYTPHADFGDDRLYWSRDDGATWSELNRSIRNVRCFAFGKARNGGDQPTLFFWGEVRGRLGLYLMSDWASRNPVLLTRFPSPILSIVSSLGADMTSYGRVWVGTSCGGVVQIDVA